jgi:hypothetical protein
VLALICARRKSNTNPFVPLLGLASCSLLITACVTGLVKTGIGSLTMFSMLLIVGITMFLVTPGRYLSESTEV